MKKIKLLIAKYKRWTRYIGLRRVYWDVVIAYGSDCVAARYFRFKVYQNATPEQYRFALSYAELIETSNHKLTLS